MPGRTLITVLRAPGVEAVADVVLPYVRFVVLYARDQDAAFEAAAVIDACHVDAHHLLIHPCVRRTRGHLAAKVLAAFHAYSPRRRPLRPKVFVHAHCDGLPV